MEFSKIGENQRNQNELQSQTQTENQTQLINIRHELAQDKDEEDIIIICSAKELAQRFLQDYYIVWYEPDISSQENKKNLETLRVDYDVESFDDWEKACHFIKGTKTFCYLITSDFNGEKLVKEVANLVNVPSIYIYLAHNINDQCLWRQSYSKVYCVEKEFNTLLSKIDEDLKKNQREVSYQRHDLPSFAPIFEDSHLSDLNDLHLYLKTCVGFKNRELAKQNLLEISKMRFKDKNNIQEFKDTYTNYDMKSILHWYTRQSFVYQSTNNCLRVATYDSILYCRLILSDLEKAIKEQYNKESKKFNGLLYRGAYLSDQEWNQLKENVGKDIEMHGFLSTSKEEKTALKFMNSDLEKKAWITIVVLPDSGKEEQGFAELKEFSKHPNEDEVLFNVRSRFTVLEVRMEKNQKGQEYRHLVLLHGGYAWKKHISQKKPSFEVIISKNIKCSDCEILIGTETQKEIFVTLGNYEKYYCRDCAENLKDGCSFLFFSIEEKLQKNSDNEMKFKVSGEVLKLKKNDIPFYGYKCSNCGQAEIGPYYTCLECEKTKKIWCKACMPKEENCKKNNHQILFEKSAYSFWNLGMTKNQEIHNKFWSKETSEKLGFNWEQYKCLNKTHETYRNKKLLEEMIKKKSFNNNILAILYNNLSQVYSDLGNHQEAIEFNKKSFNIYRDIYGENHPETATSYNNLAEIYSSIGRNEEAIELHKKSINILQASYGEKHFQTATSFNNLAKMYSNVGKNEEAIQLYEKALGIVLEIRGEHDPYIASLYNNIAGVYLNLGRNEKASEFHQKSLDITIAIYGEKHPQVATLYNNIAGVYSNLGCYEKSTQFRQKSFDITKAFYGENHPQTAASYDNLGKEYLFLGNDKKAIEYLQKSIDIARGFCVGNKFHPQMAITYNHIAEVYSFLRDYQKSIEFNKKTLEITLDIYGEHHPRTALAYNNLAETYRKLGEKHKALELLKKSFSICLEMYKDNHPDIAALYNNLGQIYSDLEDNDKAIKMYEKSLHIKNAIYQGDRLDTADSYNNLAATYLKQGDAQKAIKWFQKTLGIKLAILGENHIDIAICYDNLARTYSDIGNNKKAIELLEKSHKIRLDIHGKNHPLTAASLHNIAGFYADIGDHTKAIKTVQESLEIKLQLYGENHREIVVSYNFLVNVYSHLGDVKNANKFYSKMVNILSILSQSKSS